MIESRLPAIGARRVPGFDTVLGALALAVAAFGVLMVYSATRSALVANGDDPRYYLKRQAVFVVIGVAVMLGVSRIDYRRFEQLATPAYVLSILALLAVRYTPLGSNALGSTRWFNLHFIQVQPSEFTVLAMILAIATYCERRPDGLSMRDVWRLLLMAGLPIFLVYLQPDLGTAIIMVVVLMVMLAIAGVPPRFLVLMTFVAAVIAFLALLLGVLNHYQIVRFTGFLQGNVWQTNQSKNAIGAGGLLGSGLFQGFSTHGFVPEQQTDFIFTVVGSQLGFIGASGLIVALGAIAARMLRASMLARDHLGRLLAVGVFTFFAFSCFQNVAMIMGLMPVTGIPLPLVSYGGSAAVCFFLSAGVVLSVTSRRSVRAS